MDLGGIFNDFYPSSRLKLFCDKKYQNTTDKATGRGFSPPKLQRPMLGCMHQELLQLLHVDLQMDWKQLETTAPNLIQTSILITRPSLLSTGTIGTLRSKPRRPRCCAISVTLVVSSSGNHSKLTRRYNLVACSLSTILESARDSTMSLGRRIQSAVTPGNHPKSSKIYLLLGGVLFWFIFAWSAWGVLLWQHVQPRTTPTSTPTTRPTNFM